MPVSFHYQIPSFRLRNQKKIIDWILLSAFLEKREIEKLDFVFCADQYLLGLNKKFLSKKTYTDIITFDSSRKNKITAEIYISIPRIRANATYFKVSFEKELYRVMIHGLLHCFGYGDKNVRDQNIMRYKEDENLRLLQEML